jgi:hypothetical protein
LCPHRHETTSAKLMQHQEMLLIANLN